MGLFDKSNFAALPDSGNRRSALGRADSPAFELNVD